MYSPSLGAARYSSSRRGSASGGSSDELGLRLRDCQPGWTWAAELAARSRSRRDAEAPCLRPLLESAVTHSWKRIELRRSGGVGKRRDWGRQRRARRRSRRRTSSEPIDLARLGAASRRSAGSDRRATSTASSRCPNRPATFCACGQAHRRRAAGRTSAFDFDLAIEFASPDNVTPLFGAPLLPAAPPLASPGRECDGDDVHARSLRNACESAPRRVGGRRRRRLQVGEARRRERCWRGDRAPGPRRRRRERRRRAVPAAPVLGAGEDRVGVARVREGALDRVARRPRPALRDVGRLAREGAVRAARHARALRRRRRRRAVRAAERRRKLRRRRRAGRRHGRLRRAGRQFSFARGERVGRALDLGAPQPMV